MFQAYIGSAYPLAKTAASTRNLDADLDIQFSCRESVVFNSE